MKSKLKENNAITLIALIITIIVLLILAGITLNLVMGDNGIITKAQRSKEITNQTNAEEEIKLAILEVQAEKAKNGETATLEDLVNYLKDKKTDEYEIEVFSTESAKVTIKTGEEINLKTEAKRLLITNITSYGVEVEVTNTFKVSATGVTNTPGSSGVSTGPMIIEKGQTEARPITTADYGRKVSYLNADGSGQVENRDWRLFYVEDSSNLFKDGEGTIYLKADWKSSNYKCSTTYNPETTLIRRLNPDWAKARGDSESSWKTNEKAAAQLCDPSVWEPTYKSTNPAYANKINWVVGAPPVEMFMKSYSQRVNGAENYGAKYYQDGASYGYKYTTNGSEFVYETVGNTIYPKEANGMYLSAPWTGVGPKMSAYLASPSSYSLEKICFSNSLSENVSFTKYDGSYEVCPLVSLQSSVILQEID